METFYMNYKSHPQADCTQLEEAQTQLIACSKDQNSFLNSSLVNTVRLIKSQKLIENEAGKPSQPWEKWSGKKDTLQSARQLSRKFE